MSTSITDINPHDLLTKALEVQRQDQARFDRAKALLDEAEDLLSHSNRMVMHARNFLALSQRLDAMKEDAQPPITPCRCGPDGCSDSVACPRRPGA